MDGAFTKVSTIRSNIIETNELGKDGNIGKLEAASQAVMHKKFGVILLISGWQKDLWANLDAKERAIGLAVVISKIAVKSQIIRRGALQFVKVRKQTKEIGIIIFRGGGQVSAN